MRWLVNTNVNMQLLNLVAGSFIYCKKKKRKKSLVIKDGWQMANSGQVKDGASHALTLHKFDICCFPFKWSPKHANLQISPPAPRWEATNVFHVHCTSSGMRGRALGQSLRE